VIHIDAKSGNKLSCVIGLAVLNCATKPLIKFIFHLEGEERQGICLQILSTSID